MQAASQRSALAERLAELTKPVEEMEDGLLASATYDGDRRLAVLKFYDHKNGRFWLWADNTGHRPYCFTRLPMEELGAVKARKDVVEITEEERLDLLNDEKVKLRKIVTTDPLAIGGGNNSIRDEIKAWEADIKYYENYAYDRGLKMGTYYRVTGGRVSPLKHPMPENVARSLETILKKNPPEFEPYLREWAELLGEPLVEFRRVAMDIEVANEEGRMPDPEDPTQPVISVSFVNEHEKLVYALRKQGQNPSPSDFWLELFDDETDLIRAVFSKMLEYPVIITFNGDNFDLRYLKHRADKRRIPEEEDPIELQRVESSVKHGIHLDLYNFFKNRSIQVYAFSNKYSDYTLNTISEALIGKSKIEFEGNIGDLPLEELARYNLNDSQLTYELTCMGGSVAMKLLLVIARIGKMPMNDVGRLGVSNWIRSMLFFEHRRLGALIPRPDELSEKGGATSQATIKGKKYKGGLVIEPKPGVYFDVSVFDFASLYPSLIKVHNLSYETVDCPHEECRRNTVPETASWVCTKRKGITSLVIGSLRDLRVSHYKPLTKNPSLSRDDRELYNVVSQGLKVFLNATYGAFGFESFAFYCLPVAEATAALGRFAITKTIDKCKQLGVNVLYSDSVTGERCVTLLDEMGFLRIVPIESFFESSTGRIIRTDGKEEAHPHGWKALSMNPMTGRVGFKPVKAVIRHKASKRVFRVIEKWGVTRVTEDHSVLASGMAGFSFERPVDLEDHHLVRAGKIPLLRKVDEIDVYELMKGIRYRTIYKRRAKVLQAHCDEEWVWFGRTNRSRRVRVKRHIRVGSPEFLALVDLVGAYVPEGSSSTPETTVSRFGASIANGDAAWLSRLKECYLTLFDGSRASIVRSDLGERHLAYQTSGGVVETTYVDDTLKLQMMNETAAVFFKSLAGQGSRGKKLPDFIFHVPEEYQKLLLDSLVKGDGSKKFGKRYSAEYIAKNFKYETGSVQLASGISTLLLLLGVCHTINYRGAKGTYAIVTSSKYNRRESSPRVVEEPYDGYVYDLSVADYHTFVDSCGSIVLKNTDSLFLQNPSKEQSGAVTKWAEEDLGVELDLDKSYRYVAFSSRKKNYFGVLPDGTVDIRGLTGKKSQTPEYLKKNFYDALDILSSVKSPDDFERARARTRELLTNMVNNLKGKRVPVADLAFNVMMGKPTDKYSGTTPQHVRAAQALERKGREVKAGDIIGYVKTKSPPYVKPVELAKADDVDPDKYIEYAHSMFDQMLDALDFSFDEIMGATTLDLFWS
ncbi:MAG: ribonuclease H-like domain-containing protein [Nitrososphaerota archaeon]|nr:ribonuclease H-like domain-containing protein [Nitrososphaerota archaeon]